MNTALNDSRTDASGWVIGTIAGCTRTATSPPLDLLDDGQQLDDVAEAGGEGDVVAVMPVMPSR